MPLLLAMVLMVLAPATARTPERLIDRPAPQVKLVPAIGWRLGAVAMMDVANGANVLVVEGDVFNTSDSERASPKIRLAVLDRDVRLDRRDRLRADQTGRLFAFQRAA